jgi:hypothetical protein
MPIEPLLAAIELEYLLPPKPGESFQQDSSLQLLVRCSHGGHSNIRYTETQVSCPNSWSDAHMEVTPTSGILKHSCLVPTPGQMLTWRSPQHQVD